MRWIPVWRRNFLVWRKLLIASMLSNLADPLIMLFGLGYGLGALLPSVEGMSYLAFFAAGSLCSATMFTASFESMFSGFSRMHGQKTWDAILYAPLVIDDVVGGELMWAASKAWLTGSTILAVILVFGLAASPIVLLALFFPVEQLPAPVIAVAQALPLYHGVELVRPLVAGRWPAAAALHVGVLIGYAAVAYTIVVILARKRFSV